MLYAVHPIAEVDLQHALRALADAELLYVRGIAPRATYLFKHALIQDAPSAGICLGVDLGISKLIFGIPEGIWEKENRSIG